MKQYTNVNSLHCGRSIFSSASWSRLCRRWRSL